MVERFHPSPEQAPLWVDVAVIICKLAPPWDATGSTIIEMSDAAIQRRWLAKYYTRYVIYVRDANRVHWPSLDGSWIPPTV